MRTPPVHVLRSYPALALRLRNAKASLSRHPISFSTAHDTRRTFATVLPSIPGRVLVNAELNNKLKLEDWRNRSHAKDALDLLMLQDDADPPAVDKAVLALGRGSFFCPITSSCASSPSSSFGFAEQREQSHQSEIATLTCFLCYSMDRYNRTFWLEQGKRLFDALGEESFKNRKGLQVLFHHGVKDVLEERPELETGLHRLVTTVYSCDLWSAGAVFGGGAAKQGSSEVATGPETGRVGGDDDAVLRLLPAAADQSAEQGGKARSVRNLNNYQSESGRARITVTGRLPLGKLVCSDPRVATCSPIGEAGGGKNIVDPSAIADVLAAVRAAMAAKRLPRATLLLDARDGALMDGLRAAGLKVREEGIAVTAVPFNLTPAEEAFVLKTPMVVPWEAIPFDRGQIVF